MTGSVHILVGGPIHKITVGRRRLHFEMHPYCGPMPCTARGDELKNVPELFWHAVTLWCAQGQRINDQNEAIWEYGVKL